MKVNYNYTHSKEKSQKRKKTNSGLFLTASMIMPKLSIYSFFLQTSFSSECQCSLRPVQSVISLCTGNLFHAAFLILK